MRLASHIVRFDMRGIPVVGNTASGTLVGLTPEGAELCDAMLEREVAQDEIPAECEELLAHLADHGFTEEVEMDGRACLASAYLHVSNTCNLSCVWGVIPPIVTAIVPPTRALMICVAQSTSLYVWVLRAW